MKRLLCLIILIVSLLAVVGCSCASESKNNKGKDKNKENETISSTVVSSETDESSPDHTHVMSEWEILDAASCIKVGTRKRECLSCGETQTEAYTTSEHKKDVARAENRVEPTCNSVGGYDSVTYCLYCGVVMETYHVDLPTTDHRMTDIRQTEEYCGSTPVSNVYCGDCGAFVVSLGHRYAKEQTPSTCTESGFEREYCTLCGDSTTTYYEATGHIWQLEIVSEATCISGAETKKVCLACGEVGDISQEEAPLEHNYVSVEPVSDGIIEYKCSECGNSYEVEAQGKVYTVTFELNGGFGIFTQNVEEGKGVVPQTPSKSGYSFDGWYTDQYCTEEYIGQGVYADITLYAKWVEDQELSVKDNSVVMGVDTTFAFDVVINDEADISSLVKVYDVCGNEVNTLITPKGDGIYTVSSEEYKAGAFYYAAVVSPARFADTEQSEKQFTVLGQGYTNISLKKEVELLNADTVYGIIQDEAGYLLLTTAKLSVGGDVAIYEGDVDNVLLILRVTAEKNLLGYNAYSVEVSDYAAVFDSFEMSLSEAISFEGFQLNGGVAKEIEEQFMSSDLYKGAKAAAEALAMAEKITLEIEDFTFIFGIKDGALIVGLEHTFKYKGGFEVKLKIENKLTLKSDVYFNGIDNYAFLATQVVDTNIRVDGSVGYEESFFGTKTEYVTRQKYKELVEKYKEYLKTGAGAAAPSKDGCVTKKRFDLGTVTVPAGTVKFVLNVGFEIDFSVAGAIVGDFNFQTESTFGVRNTLPVSSMDFKVNSIQIYAKAGIEISPMLTVEIGANAFGMVFYADAKIGPYAEAGVAGVLSYNGKKIEAPRGSAYFEVGIKSGAKVGIKYELDLFYKKYKLFDLSYEIYEGKTPIKTYGGKVVDLYFAVVEDELKVSCDCGQSYVFDLDQISTEIVSQDYSKLELVNTVVECQFTVSALSSGNVTAVIHDGKLTLIGATDDVTVTLTVKYNDVIIKDVIILVKTEHTDGCAHNRCDEHSGGNATCTSRAICEKCGMEYGELAEHVLEDGICTVCGDDSSAPAPDGSVITVVDDDTVLFGSYPQTRVTNSTLIENLNKRAGALPTKDSCGEWTDYGYYLAGTVESYMWYVDVSYGSGVYRGVYFTTYRPDDTTQSSYSEQDKNGYLTGTVYWFKFEPVSWTVLRAENGTALILCDMIIDSQAFQNEFYLVGGFSAEYYINGTSIYANNYESSTLRQWLNDVFYDTAFNSLQKDIILLSTVKNNVQSTGENTNKYTCADTEDYVFLLSREELESLIEVESDRVKTATDYAYSQGADGNNEWWLRSPSHYWSYYGMTALSDGSVNLSAAPVDFTQNGVAPALWVNLNSKGDSDDSDENSGEATKGLEYTLNADGSSYSVSGIGSCTGVSNITIPDEYDGKPVTEIAGFAFSGCDNLVSITIGNEVTTIGEGAFSGCKSLASVKLGASVSSINPSAFVLCKSIEEIEVARGNTDYKAIDGNLYSADGKILVKYSTGKQDVEFVIPSTVEKIENSAFRYCKNLSRLVVPDSVVEMGAYAFADSSIVDVTLGKGVTVVSVSAFSGAEKLTSVTMLGDVTGLSSHSFAGCKSLETIELPFSVTTIGYRAFSECRAFTSIVLSCNVTRIESDAFVFCNNLTIYCEVPSQPVGWAKTWNAYTKDVVWGYDNITSDSLYDYVIHNGKAYLLKYKGDEATVTVPTEIDGYKVAFFGSVYSENSTITSVHISDNITSLAYRAFYACENLVIVTIGNDVETIGDEAFYECESLETVVIGSGLKYIGENAFKDCDNLSSIAIPNGVVSIGDYAFNWCKSLTQIIIPESVTAMGYKVFDNCRELTIYCEISEKPEGWKDSWNSDKCPVIWGYGAE